MKFLTKDDNLKNIIKNSPNLILQFGSDSCPPCHSIRARLDTWMNGKDFIDYVYIDIDEFLEDSAQMGVLSAPTIMFFIEGKEVLRIGRYFSLDEFLKKVERYLEMM